MAHANRQRERDDLGGFMAEYKSRSHPVEVVKVEKKAPKKVTKRKTKTVKAILEEGVENANTE